MDKEGRVPAGPARLYRRAAVCHQLVLAGVGEQGGRPVLGAHVGWYTFWHGFPTHIHGPRTCRLIFPQMIIVVTRLTLRLITAELHNRRLRDLRRVCQRGCLVYQIRPRHRPPVRMHAHAPEPRYLGRVLPPRRAELSGVHHPFHLYMEGGEDPRRVQVLHRAAGEEAGDGTSD